ncbi:MAG: Gfo/Idh/MocA family protein [Candidatus Nitrospinota bacterium M3_3B_026]
MTKKGQYRAAIIGTGRIGSLLEDDPLRGKPASHAGAFAAHPKTVIAAGCDINPENLEKFGGRWGTRRLYSDFREMIQRERPDIVSVATWTDTHAEIVIHAAEKGVKGIYCEKPIAVAASAAKEMIQACEENGAALVIGHERRWDSRFRVIRDMLSAGKLGALRSMTGYTLSLPPPKLSREKHGGGPMFHDGTHLVDLFRFFAGEAAYVIGIEDRPHGESCVESTALGLVVFENGAKGLILGGGERGYFHFEIDIQTDMARVILGNHTHRLYMTKPSKRFTGFSELERVPFPDSGPAVNPFVGGVSDLIEQMETGKRPVSSGYDGYKALEMIEALYESAGNGRSPALLPLSGAEPALRTVA